MQLLEKRIPILPSPTALRKASRKMHIIEAFDKVAREVTHTVRPTSHIVQLPMDRIPKDVVFKREASDTSSHVYLPKHAAKLGRDGLNKQLVEKSAGYRWFGQTYVPQLRAFGEWRVLIVGGQILQVIVTQPKRTDQATNGLMDVDIVYSMWSLQELT